MTGKRSMVRAVLCVAMALAAVLTGASVAQAAAVSYTVRVRTCDVPGASTDGNLHITIIGTAGEVPATPLNHPGNDREQGQTDEYSLVGEDIGPVTAIVLQFRLAGSSDWCLSDVVIFGPHGVTVHPFNAFMGGNRNVTIPAV